MVQIMSSDNNKEKYTKKKEMNTTGKKVIPIPKYNGNESLTKYMRRLEDYKIMVNQERYNIILDFVNSWLKLEDINKYTSLMEFKDITERRLLIDLKHNRKLLRDHSDRIINELGITISVDEETASDEITDKYIITFLTKALASIDYTLTHKSTARNVFYTIKSK
jgi:hypothetical protein